MVARRNVLAVILFRPSGEVMSGSGFVIRRTEEASIVVTSSHTLGIVSDEDVLRVRYPTFPTGVEEVAATILHQDPLLDVAILRVPGLTRLFPLRFAPQDTTVGESVVAVGYCDPDDLLDGLAFTRLPAISPGLVRYIYDDSIIAGFFLLLLLRSRSICSLSTSLNIALTALILFCLFQGRRVLSTLILMTMSTSTTLCSIVFVCLACRVDPSCRGMASSGWLIPVGWLLTMSMMSTPRLLTQILFLGCSRPTLHPRYTLLFPCNTICSLLLTDNLSTIYTTQHAIISHETLTL